MEAVEVLDSLANLCLRLAVEIKAGRVEVCDDYLVDLEAAFELVQGVCEAVEVEGANHV